MNLLNVRDLAVEFRIDETTRFDALKGISFDVPAQASVALVGESGSGKSVTALAIMGLLPKENAGVHAASKILYKGRNLLAAAQPPELGRDLDDLPGADELAQSGVHGRLPAR